MKKAKKTFDCVEMMHRGVLRIHEKIKDMTMEEEKAYWQEREEEARKKYPKSTQHQGNRTKIRVSLPVSQ